MTLHEELSALIPMLGTDSPEFYDKVKSIASRYNSDDDKKTIADFISGRMQDIDNRIEILEERTIRLQMQEVSDVISLSYLAKHYFNKSRSWLYQRMIATLNRALKDISEKLGSLSISY